MGIDSIHRVANSKPACCHYERFKHSIMKLRSAQYSLNIITSMTIHHTSRSVRMAQYETVDYTVRRGLIPIKRVLPFSQMPFSNTISQQICSAGLN